jgi:hypothetical protein
VPLGSPAAFSKAGRRAGGRRRLYDEDGEAVVLAARAMAQAMRSSGGSVGPIWARLGPIWVLKAAVVECLCFVLALPGASLLRPGLLGASR